MEPRIPKESAPFDTDGRWTRTWIMYFESLFDLSVEEAVKEAGTVTHTGGDLTKDLPVFGNDKDDVKVGTKSGNTNEVATVAGAVVTGNTVKWDADGNLIDAGVTPGGGGGGGTVTAVTGTAPIASSGGATPAISIATFTGDSGSGGAKGAVPAPAAGDAAANKVLGAGGGWVAGGSGGTPAYISSLIAGPDTTKTITGATHGYATAGLLVQVYDNASPRNAIAAGWTVNSSTFDVVITFASPQSNYYVVINGAVGPAGPTGPAGSGTVTSVALTVPAEFSVSGSPVTTSGTLAVSKATQSANTVYAGPTSGGAAAPAFRAVDPADLPLASSSAFGAVKVDGTTITASSGVISAVGGGGGSTADTAKTTITPITVANWTTLGTGGTRTDTTGPTGGGAIAIKSNTGTTNIYGAYRSVPAGDFSHDFVVRWTIVVANFSLVQVGFTDGTKTEGVDLIAISNIPMVATAKCSALSGGTYADANGKDYSTGILPPGNPYIIRLIRTGTALAGYISFDGGCTFVRMFNDTTPYLTASAVFFSCDSRTAPDPCWATLISSTLV